MTDLGRKVVYGTYKASKRVASFFGTIANVMQVVQREHHFWDIYPLSFRERASAWCNGFASRGYLLLELDKNDPEKYLSYSQQAKRIYPGINEEYMDVIENKVGFHLSMAPYTDYVPELFGYVRNSEFVPTSEHVEGDLISIVDSRGDVIVKPIMSAGGKSVHHIKSENGSYFINGSSTEPDAVTSIITDLDEHLVVEYVDQHEYSEEIWPESTNTVRVLTMIDPDTGEFFVGRATHRFGGSGTGPTDNWSGGGFAAPVDVDTGQFQQLVTYSTEEGKQQFDCHPETGTTVAGKHVPHWDRIQSAVVEVAEIHEQNSYVGWDVVLDSNGEPKIIEGNCAPGLTTLQLGWGLFEDERIERFLQSDFV